MVVRALAGMPQRVRVAQAQVAVAAPALQLQAAQHRDKVAVRLGVRPQLCAALRALGRLPRLQLACARMCVLESRSSAHVRA